MLEQLSAVAEIVFDLRFVLLVLAGAAAGLLVGALPGLSVSMATALLVSVTYSWSTADALATIMGVYVVGVFSGAVSAILINIPGAPSSVVTTLDGYPMAQHGEANRALQYATVYSFVGTLFGILALWVLAGPISAVALRFTPMDYFLLAALGLTTVGGLTAKSPAKGFVSAAAGLVFSMVGLDPVLGSPRLTLGLSQLQTGINIVPALVGLFGFSELLWMIGGGDLSGSALPKSKKGDRLMTMLKQLPQSLYYSLIGMLVGALPGAGGPVASFLAYGEAKRITKKPSRPFGQGAVEGIVASEAANNACIGGALIPMLTLAVPGDAVTAIVLSVFMVHGLQPGPMFIQSSPQIFYTIIAGGLLGAVFLLAMGLLLAPRLGRLLQLPRRRLIPVVAALCVIGAFACNNRIFDVYLMLFFGVLGYLMRRREYPTAPMTLALVLGSMMDTNFRRAVSLASSADCFFLSLLGRPVTLMLLTLLAVVLAAALLTSTKTAKRRRR
ncbi:MAG: tripartite tricarboxylate transporter permease [Angelakisella sp.]